MTGEIVSASEPQALRTFGSILYNSRSPRWVPSVRLLCPAARAGGHDQGIRFPWGFPERHTVIRVVLDRPSAARTHNASRVVEYLLSIVSSVCMLPPEGLLLPQLDARLVEAFGVLCASEPSVLDRFPEVGGAAVRALLQSKPLDELCRMSNSLKVDISMCDNRADLIQAMLDKQERIPVDGEYTSLRTNNVSCECDENGRIPNVSFIKLYVKHPVSFRSCARCRDQHRHQHRPRIARDLAEPFPLSGDGPSDQDQPEGT